MIFATRFLRKSVIHYCYNRKGFNMRRKLLDQLLSWKDSSNRKPLILQGARQVGKTYLLKTEFGEKYFDNVLYVNMQNPDERVRQLFEGGIKPARILDGLRLIFETDITPDNTLLIFDEIQEIPRALTSLKYFYEEAPEYHIVAAGSLLGIFLADDTSFPVGKIDFMRLEPMDFEEFLWANGREQLAAAIKNDGDALFMRETLVDLLRNYMAVGGMPEAVASWISKHSIDEVSTIQSNILTSYQNDFVKHTDRVLATRILQIFRSLPEQFARGNGRFVYGVARGGARANDYEIAIEWLVNAGIVRRVFNISRGDKLPLKSYVDRKAFKLYFLDVGLFRQLADIPTSSLMDNHTLLADFNGLLAEQYVLQQLSADRELFYWTSGATAEVDFVLQDNAKARIVPIEVKSGGNTKAKSLGVYCGKYKPQLAVRFSMNDMSYSNGLLDMPLFYSLAFDNLLSKY